MKWAACGAQLSWKQRQPEFCGIFQKKRLAEEDEEKESKHETEGSDRKKEAQTR